MNPENLTLLEADNLPAGSVIKDVPDYDGDRPAALTKQDDGRWTCDRCEDPHTLSVIYRSDHTYSLKSLGELPKGFVFGLPNLGLSKFAPEGTLVSDRDSDGAAWEKIGNDWVNGITHEHRLAEVEDLDLGHNWTLSRIWAPYTVISPEKEAEDEGGLSAEEATGLKDKMLKDRHGDLWRFHDGEWQFINSMGDWIPLHTSRHTLLKDYEPYAIHDSDGGLSAVEAGKLTDRVLRDRTGDLWKMIDGKWHFSMGGEGFTEFLGHYSDELPPAYEPYEVVKSKGLTAEDLMKNPDRLYYDAEGDLWGSRNGKWAWGTDLENLERKLSGILFLHSEPFSGDIEPYRVAEGVSLPESKPEPGPEPEEEKTPTTMETWLSIAASLERIANALEEK